MEDTPKYFAGRKYGTRELIEMGVITGELAQMLLENEVNPLPPMMMTVTSVDTVNRVITFDSATPRVKRKRRTRR